VFSVLVDLCFGGFAILGPKQAIFGSNYAAVLTGDKELGNVNVEVKVARGDIIFSDNFDTSAESRCQISFDVSWSR
jgi:hypothetical protein